MDFWIGIAGVAVGATIQIITHAITKYIDKRDQKDLDDKRKSLLIQMLESGKHDWRNIDTLSNVIGADELTTKRLLIDIGARASEIGDRKWALIKNKPLP